jgi:hypothetical protein
MVSGDVTMRDNKGRFVKGIVPANKKLDAYQKCVYCNKPFKINYSFPTKQYCKFECWVETVRGVPKSEKHIQKMRENNARYWLGKKQSAEHIAKATRGLKEYQSGAKHWNWKGGVTPLQRKLRFTNKYRQWRVAIFERDDYTCVLCNARGGELNADHYPIPYAQLVYEKNWKTLYDLSNGRTLCIDCHRKTPTYATKFKVKVIV